MKLSVLHNLLQLSNFKQDSGNLKDNYRTISIVPILSKMPEKLVSGQLSNHFDIFSNFKCGFRKYFSAQQCHCRSQNSSSK